MDQDQSVASTSWHLLREDVIDEILSRLPVKSLIQFKSVCKRWHALPTNPNFIASHLRHVNTPDRLVSWNGNHDGLIVEHDAFHVFTECEFERYFQPVNLYFGFDRKPDLVLGPCEGIFCLHWRPNSAICSRVGSNVERLPTIALLNPATRAFGILPVSKFDVPPYRKVAYSMVGFNFDLTTKSIKVVRVVNFQGEKVTRNAFINCAEVYELGSGSWRVLNVDDIVQEVYVSNEAIISMYNHNDGVFHWHSLPNDRARGVDNDYVFGS
ncbi:putative F-box/kelch-repeat protein At1g12870 isoform X1 [Rhododendron vialii]|uniref:putative F-box/kelch-repeat protein At1g12870 isoform X1 n=1 Tax=Rhododendron vialii TaxID=182163 RepID=UPI00265EEBE3|nr:putative F-box/kelch-repeat protein At1g12870 isoform X1 [Rhododendron vialii]XP_058190308.1 putative F-box/kelch-repeat protein At1g12870 isoform X1 [Rhododendron vialii]